MVLLLVLPLLHCDWSNGHMSILIVNLVFFSRLIMIQMTTPRCVVMLLELHKTEFSQDIKPYTRIQGKNVNVCLEGIKLCSELDKLKIFIFYLTWNFMMNELSFKFCFLSTHSRENLNLQRPYQNRKNFLGANESRLNTILH